MTARNVLRRGAGALSVATLVAAAGACGKDSVSPIGQIPARVDPASNITVAASVGSALTNALVVKVTNASGSPVANAAVAFAVTQGNGSTNPRVANTDSKGMATSSWTLGTILGPNEVTASVTGVSSQVKFSATGAPGPVVSINLAPQNPRLLPGTDSVRITASSLDSFGNQTSPPPTFTVRDPSLLSVDGSGLARVLRRGAGTYVVATAGGKSDSVLVTVLAPGQSICTAAANPVDLPIGQVLTDASGQGFCVHASSANAEYAIVPFYNSGVPSATITVDVRGQGLTTLPVPTSSLLPLRGLPTAPAKVLSPDDDFEARLRRRERNAGIGRHVHPNSALTPNRSTSAQSLASDEGARDRRRDDAQRQPHRLLHQSGLSNRQSRRDHEQGDRRRRHGEPRRRLHRRGVPVDRRHVRHARRSRRPRRVRRSDRHRQQRPRHHVLHARRERDDHARDPRASSSDSSTVATCCRRPSRPPSRARAATSGR